MSLALPFGDPLAEPTHALSLRQPWAWLVVSGVKPIENRKWPTRRRGAFYIHAAQGMKRAEYDDAAEVLRMLRGYDLELPPFDTLPLGGIVGRARLFDVLPPCIPEEYVCDTSCGCGHPWHFGKQYGFLLDDIQEVPFTALRGMLGFFRVPAEVLRALAP